MKYILGFKQLTLLILMAAAVNLLSAKDINYDEYSAILQKYVSPEGLVDYEGLKNDKALDNFMKYLAEIDISAFHDKEKLALYINAYNVFTLQNVINYYPINSPFDVEGFFKEKKFTLAGKSMTLDELEYDLIFPINNTLVHFGLVCAAVSCPKLITEVYKGDNVYVLLKKNALKFLGDTSRNRLDKENNVLYLSEIFKWFGDAFVNYYGSLQEFAKQLAPQEIADYLKNNEVEVEFVTYDWTLNKQ